jgi:hypothetical protein
MVLEVLQMNRSSARLFYYVIDLGDLVILIFYWQSHHFLVMRCNDSNLCYFDYALF